MDTAVANTLATGLGDLSDDALAQFGAMLPIGFGVLITVAVTFFAIKTLRGLIHI